MPGLPTGNREKRRGAPVSDHPADSPGRRRVTSLQWQGDSAGLAGLARRLARHGAADLVPIAVERPDGRLVDVLLEAGHPVVPVSPNAIKTWRESETGSGGKSDAGDAYVIADYLRCRARRLSVAVPYSPQTKASRTVVRTRDDLVDLRVAVTNQLSALLEAHRPGAKATFADVESPIALQFLTRYPSARHAQHLGAKRLTTFCAKHGYSGRRSGEQLLARLRAAPAGTLDETLSEAVRDAVIAEWGDCRQAYDGPDAVAAPAGATPVTKESGEHRAVHFRWACNKRFRQAITTFADNSRHASPWAAKVYTDARARGLDHPHAIRVLARAWIRVIRRCWQDSAPYDPARHGNAVRLTQPGQNDLRAAGG